MLQDTRDFRILENLRKSGVWYTRMTSSFKGGKVSISALLTLMVTTGRTPVIQTLIPRSWQTNQTIKLYAGVVKSPQL